MAAVVAPPNVTSTPTSVIQSTNAADNIATINPSNQQQGFFSFNHCYFYTVWMLYFVFDFIVGASLYIPVSYLFVLFHPLNIECVCLHCCGYELFRQFENIWFFFLKF